METLYTIGFYASCFIVGLCIYEEICLYNKLMEEKKKARFSHTLRVGPGGFLLGRKI